MVTDPTPETPQEIAALFPDEKMAVQWSKRQLVHNLCAIGVLARSMDRRIGELEAWKAEVERRHEYEDERARGDDL